MKKKGPASLVKFESTIVANCGSHPRFSRALVFSLYLSLSLLYIALGTFSPYHFSVHSRNISIATH